MQGKYGAMPSANYIVTDKMQRKKVEKHKQNLAKVTYSIDNKPPVSLGPNGRPPQDRKRLQMRMERMRGIERSNRILFEKMAQIKAKRSLDNVNFRKPRSLNGQNRQVWLKRISKQNMQILDRIKRTEPMYSTKKWEAEKKIHEAFIQDRKRVNDRRRAYMSNRDPSDKHRGKSQKAGKRRPRTSSSKHRSRPSAEGAPEGKANAESRPMSALS